MCDPLTIAGAALTAGSMLAKQQAASRVASARNAAIEAETVRQRGHDQEVDALNAMSRDRYTDFADQQGDKARSLGDYFGGQAKAVTESSGADEPAMPLSASNIVVAEEQKQLGKVRAYGSRQDQALGNVRAFGDLLGGIRRDQANDAARIGIIGGFKRGSQGILPLELESANNAGAKMRMLGDILGAAGGVTTMAGLGGGWDKIKGWLGDDAIPAPNPVGANTMLSPFGGKRLPACPAPPGLLKRPSVPPSTGFGVP